MRNVDRLIVPGTFIIALAMVLLVTVSWVTRPTQLIVASMTVGPPGIVPHRTYGLRFTPRNVLSHHILTNLVPAQTPCTTITITNYTLTYIDQQLACRVHDGSYKLLYHFPWVDDYVIFADIHPVGGMPQIIRHWMPLDLCALRGPDWAQHHPCRLHPANLRGQEAIRSKTKYGLTIVLGAPAHAAVAGASTQLSFVFLRNSRVATDLEPLSASTVARAIAISMNTQHLTHLYPDAGQITNGRIASGALSFHGRFDTPSIYRVFLTFRYQHHLMHIDFVIDVNPALQASG